MYTSIMCQGIGLLLSEIPEMFHEHRALTRRRFLRGNGEHECRFFWRETSPILPIRVRGELRFVRWGNWDRKSQLPVAGYTWLDSVRDGKWTELAPEIVTIVATAAYENGVWFPLRNGIQGLLVRDEREVERVYMVCREPTRYYYVMTRARWEPVLIGETI